MAADVFGSTKKLSGAIRGASIKLTIANQDVVQAAALVQSVQMQYSRQVSRLFELGSENMYYNIGNSEGQGAIQTIVGPSTTVSAALKSLGDPCQAVNNVVQFSGSSNVCGAGSGGAGSLTVTALGALLQSTSVQINAQDFLMQSGGQFMFARLEM
jgi:hypothetical protein